MRIRKLEVHDDAEVAAWWETAKTADAHGRDHPAYWSLRAATVAFRAADNPMIQHPLAAYDGDTIVGVNQVMMPRLDNTHLVMGEPLVLPEHRRRGIGTALLEAGLEVAREAGRSTMICEANLPLDTEEHAPNLAFAGRHGFEIGIVDVHRVLELPVVDTRLGELAAAAAEHHDGYTLVTWEDVVPDEHLDGFCALQTAFNSEAPSGELELENEVWDADRVRTTEERFRKQGRHETTTVAIAPDGTMVGLTEMMTTEESEGIGWQGGTLVLKDARGHRLGIALKAANLQRFQQRFPAVRTIHSWNAEVNGHMIAINEALGFRPVERVAELQRKL